MEGIFLKVLDQSIKGSYVILMILLLRLFLRMAPKKYSYALWAAAGFRLVMPVSLKAPCSLFPEGTSPRFIPADISYQAVPEIRSGLKALDSAVNQVLPAGVPETSVNPLQLWTAVSAGIWLLGLFIIVIWNLKRYLGLKKELAPAVAISEEVLEHPGLSAAFVFGIRTPRIYLPAGLGTEERVLILHHERVHIQRKDAIIKLTGFLIVTLHWFNPLVWLAFRMMTADMEASCDVTLLEELGDTVKKSYARSLVSLASQGSGVQATPLAFAEDSLSSRIQNILNHRKKPVMVSVVAALLVAGCSVGLLTDPVSSGGRFPLNDVPEIAQGGSPMEATPVAMAALDHLPAGLGSDLPFLDHAGDETIIFHNHFGLFVYDLVNQEIRDSLDLAVLGCNYGQGDNACLIQVSRDGDLVSLHPASEETMYVYRLSDRKLFRDVPIRDMADPFRTVFHENPEIPSNAMIGVQIAEFDDGTSGYLKAGSWALNSLSYERGGESIPLFPQVKP